MKTLYGVMVFVEVEADDAESAASLVQYVLDFQAGMTTVAARAVAVTSREETTNDLG